MQVLTALPDGGPGFYARPLVAIRPVPHCRANRTISPRRHQVIETKKQPKDANADPLTGAPGSHPVGTGIGAAGGAVAGAAAGAVVGGPVGAVIGAAIGGAAGGAAGHGIGESVNPTLENTYWQGTYRSRPYIDRTRPYSHYQDAYRFGWESKLANPKRKWAEAEADLAEGWKTTQSKSTLAWEQAKQAAQDAWNRVENVLPGDSDHDGH